MNTAARLAVFAAALAASLGVGLAVGAAVGPADEDDTPAPHEVDHQGESPTTTAGSVVGGSPAATTTTSVIDVVPVTTVDHGQLDHASDSTATP